MTRIDVVDASVVIEVLTQGGDALRRWIDGPVLSVPAHAQLEVLNGLRGLWLGGRLSDAALAAAGSALLRLPAATFPVEPLIGRILELRHNLTTYDASYVALAESLHTRLLTRDARLAGAPGLRCEVVLVG